jgi:Flp pilus assembly protein TadD
MALAPARALTLPLTFTLLLVALGGLPAIRRDPHLLWSFLGAAAVLLAWTVPLGAVARARGRTLSLAVVLRPQHYLQACAHLSILGYWGWYWRPVYDAAPLIAAQLGFAYAFDALLAWSRRDTYTFGFGPFPIIFSTNLFLWFKPDWFYLQFLMVAVGFAGKELIRWNKDGRQTHIFNPSSFTLMVFSVVLLLTGQTGITWGPEIATTQFNPPHIYLWIFLVTLPAQFLFGVAPMTWAAVATTYGFSLVYFAATGTHFFPERPIPIAVFLGMHLLFTDPSTSPRTQLGRLIFGVLYGLGVVGLLALLTRLGLPTFYDKLLPVPILNLTIQGIDRAARSTWVKRLDPAALGRGLVPWRRNLAYMAIWALTFMTMQTLTGTQATLVRADSLLTQGRVDEAIVRYQEFVATDPDDAGGHNNLGAALLQAGRFDEAATAFRRSIDLKPGSSETYDNLGQALLQGGHAGDALSPFRRVVELRPESAAARDNLGGALIQAGQFEDAVAALRRAVELQGDGAERLNNLGVALIRAGHPADAVAPLQRGVQLQPGNAGLFDNLGQALMQSGRFADAVASLRRATELQPDNAQMLAGLGQALLQAGRLDEANAALRRAVELKPDSPEARYNLANVLANSGQLPAAVEQLRAALGVQPDSVPALVTLAWIEATEPGVRDPEDAIRLASHAADLTGRRDARALEVLATAYSAAGRAADARAAEKEARLVAGLR